MADQTDVERGRAALRERDRRVGLAASAESARARAGRLEIELEVARERLSRKNRRIAELAGQLAALRGQAGESSSEGASGAGERGTSRNGSRRRRFGL